jgi:hypothetical protein
MDFIEHYFDHAHDNDGPHTFDRCWWEWERDGRRILRIIARDEQSHFELRADEQETNSGRFEGSWWYRDKPNAKEALSLRLYGDPSSEFALLGEYFYDEKECRWTFELYPPED